MGDEFRGETQKRFDLAASRLRLTPIRLGALLILLVLLAASLRCALLPLAIDRTLSGDPASYVNIAENLIDGDGLRRDHSPLAGGLRSYYPPAYPMLLAAMGSMSEISPLALIALHLVIDCLTALAIIWVSSTLGLRRSVGIVAAAIYILWPTNIITAPVPQKEGLSALFVVSSFGFLLRGRAIGFGLTSALLGLTQPALITLPAISALLLLKRDAVRFLVIGGLAGALVLSPWWIRNYMLFGHFIPLTTASGMSFWVGTMGDGVAYMPQVEKFTVLPEADRSSAAFSEAAAYIASDPANYLKHTFSKAVTVLQGDRWGTKPLHWMTPAKPGNFFLSDIPYFASLGLWALALVAAMRSHRNLRVILVASLLQLFCVLIWFQFSERHRYFLVPILILVVLDGAFSWSEGPFERFRAWRRRVQDRRPLFQSET